MATSTGWTRIAARVRLALAVLAFTLGLGVAHTASWALTDELLTPAAITAFEQKLESARAAHGDVSARVQCFESQDRRLVAERDADQARLGQLVGRKQQLEATLARQRAEYDGFVRERDDANARLTQLRANLEQLLAYKRAKEVALARCKADPFMPNFMCDLAMKLAELTGQIRDVDNDLVVAQHQFDSADQGMAAADARYRASQTALEASEKDATTVAAQVRETEASISYLQSTLAILRPEIHAGKMILDEFSDALDEAKRVDTADGRTRTSRKVRALATRVDEAAQSSSVLFDKARTVLTERQLTACFI